MLYRRGSVKLILSLSAKKEGFLFPVETLNISFSTEHSEIFFSIAMNTKKIVTNVQFLYSHSQVVQFKTQNSDKKCLSFLFLEIMQFSFNFMLCLWPLFPAVRVNTAGL